MKDRTGIKQIGKTSANTSRNEATPPQKLGKPSTITTTRPTSTVQQSS
jgi:hypothetical protein